MTETSTVPTLACVILTMGNRPAELERAIASVLAFDGDDVDVLVVGNGADLPPTPDGVRTLRLPDNVGIPEGRNVGVAHVTADVVLFLDDDGWYPDSSLANRLRAMFAADAHLAVVSMRIEDPDGSPGEQRHVPRLGRSDATRSSEVTTFLGGASAIRRSAFVEAGGYAGQFFFGHEESDLAWRLLDRGWRIVYAADVVMNHPALPAHRHADFYRLNARNRAWLARRNLPAPLAVAHLGVWAGITGVRLRFGPNYRVWWSGLNEGLHEDAGERHPMKWSTAWRMTRLGRPPVI